MSIVNKDVKSRIRAIAKIAVIHGNYSDEEAQEAVDLINAMITPKEIVWSRSEFFNRYTYGEYVVQNEYDENGDSEWVFGIYNEVDSFYTTEEAAKAAAQENYNRMWNYYMEVG